jgi:hypothetical protein
MMVIVIKTCLSLLRTQSVSEHQPRWCHQLFVGSWITANTILRSSDGQKQSRESTKGGTEAHQGTMQHSPFVLSLVV